MQKYAESYDFIVVGSGGGSMCAALRLRAAGLEPQAYIANVISKIAADWPATHWDELLPWNWQPPAISPSPKPPELRPSGRAYG